ncbi:MAG TPA: DJ-1/PfpI family protein [Clostridiales bacterium]|nr:DJ-1/PfpI family protein [Clostridiales bacterium]
MVYIFLAEGFEETEAIVTVDILRRAGINVKTVGVSGKVITGAHGIPVVCDLNEDEISPNYKLTGIVLPGGMPGTINLEKSQTVQKFIDFAFQNNLVIGAICAAPSILGNKGLLKGKRAVCYDGFEDRLLGAEVLHEPVCVDGKIITANGPGAVFEFGLSLARALKDEQTAASVEAAMKCRR